MKLENISYGSAVFFGSISFISMFLLGLIGMVVPEIAAMMGYTNVLPFNQVVLMSFAQGIAAYVSVVFGILVYNLIAKKYPISWKVSKK